MGPPRNNRHTIARGTHLAGLDVLAWSPAGVAGEVTRRRRNAACHTRNRCGSSPRGGHMQRLDRHERMIAGVSAMRVGHTGRIRLALLVACAVVLLWAIPSSGALHLRCRDGQRACDVDAACDGVCTFAFCPVVCVRAPCPPIYRPCDGQQPEALRATVRLDGRRKKVRRQTVGRTRVVLACRPGRSGCKPPLTTGCRAQMEKEACEAHAGDYDRRGLSPTPSCHCRTRDAGAPCGRDGDCQGLCFTDLDGQDTPHCSAHVVEFGCFTLLDERGEPHALCID